jgi:hypothetical protein
MAGKIMNWTLSLLTHLWLLGSLVLPCMLLLRWCGANWRGLSWLTRNKKRWVSVWASFGFYKVIAYAALSWVEDSYYATFALPGWSGGLVLLALRLVIPHTHFLRISSWVEASLIALQDAAIYYGYAAVVWWAFAWKAHKAQGRLGWAPTERYCAALLLSAWLMGVANIVYSWRPVTCCDFDLPYGIPFTYYHSNGWGYAGFVWKGVIGDPLVILLLGAILGWVWNWFSRKHSHVSG